MNDMEVVNNSGIMPQNAKTEGAFKEVTKEVENPIVFITAPNNKSYRATTPYSAALANYMHDALDIMANSKLLSNIADLPANALFSLQAQDKSILSNLLVNYIIRSSFEVFVSTVNSSDIGKIVNTTTDIKECVSRTVVHAAEPSMSGIINDYLTGNCKANSLLYPEVNNNVSANNVDTYIGLITNNILTLLYSAFMFGIDNAISGAYIGNNTNGINFTEVAKSLGIKTKGVDDQIVPFVLSQHLKTRLIALVDNNIMPSVAANINSVMMYIRFAPSGVFDMIIDSNRYTAKQEMAKILAEKEGFKMQ